MIDGREAEEAWDRVHEALPARWQVGRGSVSDPLRGTWCVTAIGPHPGRGKIPQTVTGTGEDEASALRDLDDRLRGVPRGNEGSQLDELRRALRLAYVQGAEEWSRENAGRGLSSDELERVVARFPR